MYEVTERLYLTADKSRAVREGDPEAAYLLATPGKKLPAAEARQYGLVDDEPEAKAVKQAPENKARTAPPATKAKGATERRAG